MAVTSRRVLATPVLAALTLVLSGSLAAPADGDPPPPRPQPPAPAPAAAAAATAAPNSWVTTWQAPGEQYGGWVNTHQPLPRFQHTTVPGGGRAWRAEVRHGDDDAVNVKTNKPILSGVRAEGVGPSETAASGTVRYQWRTMFPKDFPIIDAKVAWQVFAQWHQGDRQANPGSPPIAFILDSGKMYVHLHKLVNGHSAEVGKYEIGDITLGQWHTFQVDVTWSTDPAVGALEVRHNGTQVLFDGKPTQRGPTMFLGATRCPDPAIPNEADCTYFKMGIYRKKTVQPLPNMVVYYDDVQRLVAR